MMRKISIRWEGHLLKVKIICARPETVEFRLNNFLKENNGKIVVKEIQTEISLPYMVAMVYYSEIPEVADAH
jgi:hypothetical protein